MGWSERTGLLRDERAELGAFLSGLNVADWAAPSLCGDWTVSEVASHVASLTALTRWGLLARLARYGSGTDAANARSAAAWESQPREEIIAGFAASAPLGLGHFYPGWTLCEVLVHHQDIRRPLQAHREIPIARLDVAIRVLWYLPVLTGGGLRRRSVTLIATDSDWRRGTGPDVRGSGEAILMTLAGRTGARDELVGDGVALL